jgi:hypothetical protein
LCHCHAREAAAVNTKEIAVTGAERYLVDGLISDAGQIPGRAVAQHAWFDASTLKEPYRIEGKETMGFEIAAQMGWRAPVYILRVAIAIGSRSNRSANLIRPITQCSARDKGCLQRANHLSMACRALLRTAHFEGGDAFYRQLMMKMLINLAAQGSTKYAGGINWIRK